MTRCCRIHSKIRYLIAAYTMGLPHPQLRRSWAPAIVLSTIAAFIAGEAPARGQQMAAKQPTPIESIRVERHPNETQVVIELRAAVQFTYERLSQPDRLGVDLWGGEPGPELRYGRIRVDNPFLSAISIDKTPIGTRVLLDLTFDGPYDVYAQSNPPRIIVALKKDS